MKSKSDAKVVEQKADRSFVNQLFEFLRSQIDTFADSQREQVTSLVDAALRGSAIQMGSGGGAVVAAGPPGAHHHHHHHHRPAHHPSDLPQPLLGAAPRSPAGAPPLQLSMASTDDAAHHRVGAARGPAAGGGAAASTAPGVEAALNPAPEYQWAAQVGRRSGMPPSKVLRQESGSRTATPDRPTTRGTPSSGTRPSHAATVRVETWAASTDGGGGGGAGVRASYDGLPPPSAPLPTSLPEGQLPPLPPHSLVPAAATVQGGGVDGGVGVGATTRAQDAYARAVQPQQSLSHILESSPPGAYVPESMRRQIVPRPPAAR